MMLRQRGWVRALAAVCLVTFTAGCARGAAAPPANMPQPEPGPAEATLRPGDVVGLQIWREQGLSGEFPVDQRGEVILPKIGVMQATDVPTTELERRIRADYRKYLRNPSITITFLRRITVSGAVRAPGVYRVDPTVTVGDVVALAGGPIAYGEPDEIELLRDGRRITTDIRQTMRIDALSVRSGDQLYVPERSFIERNTGVLTTAISSLVSIGITVFSILATRDN